MLNELDKELTKRGHRFVRYADDCMILCKSTKSAMRTLENIMPYIEGRLFLKVIREKTKVAHISKVSGIQFLSLQKLKELTSRSKGWGNEYRALKLTQFIRGWVNTLDRQI
nr:reverse transcriptase domain-containing protein [uncultured Blautia sp.]